MPRPTATSALSGLTATARTGLTDSGGSPSTTFTRVLVSTAGPFAPWSIQSFRSATSSGVSGLFSLFGGMTG